MKVLYLIPAALWLYAAAPAGAQPFQLQIARDGNVSEASSGSTIDLRSPAVGGDVQATISAVYMGTVTAAIFRTELLGREEFTIDGAATPTLNPGDRYTFTVRYHARNSAFEQSLLTVTYRESGPSSAIGSFRLSLTGSAPEIAFSYSLPSDRSSRALPNNGRIDLPAIAPGSTTQATVSITNIGSGPAVVRSAAIGPAMFDLLDRPLLPANLAAGQTISFTVRASPTAVGSFTGTLQVDAPGGPFAFTIGATGSLSRPTYEFVSGGSGPLDPGSPIAFPDTLIGSQSQVRLRVLNQTAAPISITEIAISGSSDFQLTTLVAVPLTLVPGDFREIGIGFTPSRTQPATAVLKVGSDSFSLAGTGLSSILAFSYVTAEGETRIDPNGTLSFPAASVGTSQTVDFVVRNLTSQSVKLGIAGIAEAASPFRVMNSPLPAALAPQQSIRFQLAFAPVTVGVLSGTLVIDSRLFTLRAVGIPPGKLPAVTLSGPQGSIGSLQQAIVAVTLQEPYQLDVTGTLTMAFDSPSLTADPALQFSSGGRSVTFRIPAGALTARFPSGSDRVGLQTGSVAGKIHVSAAVQTSASSDLTAPPALDFQVENAAPSILAASLTGTDRAYQVQILGLTTNRSLKQLELAFVPGSKLNLSATNFKLDVSTASATWFRDSNSVQFGGLFSISVPLQLTLPASSTATPALADIIRSITVKAANDIGISAAYTINVQ